MDFNLGLDNLACVAISFYIQFAHGIHLYISKGMCMVKSV